MRCSAGELLSTERCGGTGSAGGVVDTRVQNNQAHLVAAVSVTPYLHRMYTRAPLAEQHGPHQTHAPRHTNVTLRMSSKASLHHCRIFGNVSPSVIGNHPRPNRRTISA